MRVLSTGETALDFKQISLVALRMLDFSHGVAAKTESRRQGRKVLQ